MTIQYNIVFVTVI